MFTRFNGSGSWLDLIHVRVYMHVISVVDASISIVSLLVWISIVFNSSLLQDMFGYKSYHNFTKRQMSVWSTK